MAEFLREPSRRSRTTRRPRLSDLAHPSARDQLAAEIVLDIVMLQPFVIALPHASDTAKVNPIGELWGDGIPETMPVELFRLRPAGRLPELTDTEYGASPPARLSEELYHWFCLTGDRTTHAERRIIRDE